MTTRHDNEKAQAQSDLDSLKQKRAQALAAGDQAAVAALDKQIAAAEKKAQGN